jgi:hypothetical protein
LAPIIATELAATYGSHSIGYYLAAMAVLSIVCVMILSQRMPKDFGEVADSANGSSATDRPAHSAASAN